MKRIDKDKLCDHLDVCIELAEGKDEQRIAEVLRNLQQEIRDGEFDAEEVGREKGGDE
ncbi:hypothetical protein PAECIP111893_03502 [Paenibacillus plantiphilus]|uniref:Uncharacterized protein n=1 Tax=Paenibacillus plantiphilus TaxID=2905650 RepID=A0ABN8GUM0_9BACL|nr:hypothetical protein [Paenibacillus plantiphilus]CAH1212215.1 hypothetical protein PAECIP111893_03502 [Paenibacillus plantiphilus]